MLVIILSTNLQGAKEEKQYVCEISAGNPYEIDISEDEEDNKEVVGEAGAKKVSNVDLNIQYSWQNAPQVKLKKNQLVHSYD